MDVGPARQPRSPLVFRVGAEPHSHAWNGSPQLCIPLGMNQKIRKTGDKEIKYRYTHREMVK